MSQVPSWLEDKVADYIAELEKDKARLDWLEGHIKSAGTDSVTKIRVSDLESFNLRELIDGMRSRLAKEK